METQIPQTEYIVTNRTSLSGWSLALLLLLLALVITLVFKKLAAHTLSPEVAISFVVFLWAISLAIAGKLLLRPLVRVETSEGRILVSRIYLWRTKAKMLPSQDIKIEEVQQPRPGTYTCEISLNDGTRYTYWEGKSVEDANYSRNELLQALRIG